MKLTFQNAISNFSETFALSKDKTQHGKDVIPGGFSRRTFGYGPHAIFVQKGEGAYVYTIENRRLLDLNNNFSTNVVGHNHPAIVEAITKLIPGGFSFGNPTDHELQLARILCERIESVEQVKFFCSASEACLGAVRIARGYTGRNKIAKFEGGYHGFTDDLAVSAHPNPANFPGPDFSPKSIPDSDGIPSYKVENIINVVQNDFEATESILRRHAGDIACLIMELQSGAGGIVELDKDFVRKIRKLTQELGIILIVDETITLRAAKGGLQEVYGIKPDMTVMGKMIGGGLPIGAVGGSKQIFNVMEQNQVMISGTHHGHPMACAAGIATMQIMDDSAFVRLNSKAEIIKEELNSWAAKNNYPFVVFGCFSVLGYAFTKELGQKIITHRDYWHKIDDSKMMIYALEMATRGYYPVHRGQIGLTLPMTDEDVTGYIQTTKDIISEMYA
ncbi:aminotransferase class III-fold pyridoxal phosphate-dependent enzyme [Klebsiella pneumoniae]|uniref:aspartate aminotransferase family protein n=1 Tax=Klebsiella pneumoniae TaxID=573 RepID=UPI001C7E84DB|nr:aminotransferase class III-fold pyridoxal phosphate-dependent enzyme [Klebsiella pneumoniae]MBX4531492.1 aminotransferase class III-fold pyridoxal phosphate-dependent enzyme [Klebsiella pneumoniae]MDE8408198.1 aminotransferase class III-fold pyridoxal phosphate-dependent enzyme [Klebsiella pneumoniae]HBV4967999.1 aminotransferase class III-fold pyridoxal phosphate-dependent enzyme [Klebsiella pneumoniae]